jgi:hypothetical protein
LKYDHYLQEVDTFMTDQGSLLDSNNAIIAALHEFTGKHGFVKCKDVIQSGCISRVDTLGNVAFRHLFLLCILFNTAIP